MSALRQLLEDLKAIEDQHHLLAAPEQAATAKLREITTGLVAMTEQLDSCVSSLQSSVSSLSSSVSSLSSRVSAIAQHPALSIPPVGDPDKTVPDSPAAAPKGGDNSANDQASSASAAGDAPKASA